MFYTYFYTYLHIFTHLTAGVDCCCQCFADFIILLAPFQTCSSQSSPQSAPASLGCQGPALQATRPRAVKALRRHVRSVICGPSGSRAGAHSCKTIMNPHPQKLRVLHCGFGWESGTRNVARTQQVEHLDVLHLLYLHDVYFYTSRASMFLCMNS